MARLGKKEGQLREEKQALLNILGGCLNATGAQGAPPCHARPGACLPAANAAAAWGNRAHTVCEAL